MSVYSSNVTPNTVLTDDLWNNLRKDVLQRHLSGTLADRPSPDGYGLFYYATDTYELYYSDGSTWTLVGGEAFIFGISLIGGGGR